MTRTALFVDLSNFYTQIIKSQYNSSENWRNYFMEWFDFSSLSKKITGSFSDVWVFHSDKLGPKEAKITDKHLTELVARLNSQKGVTVRNVNIKGEQREHFSVACEKCNHQIEADWKSEKGIDSSLIVHLFDTIDSWDVAYLLSGDADYVPAVSSLRRRGKTIKGAGFPKRSSAALIRECFEYVDLFKEFISDDYFTYRFLKTGGILQRYLSDIRPKQKNIKEDIRVILQRIENKSDRTIKIRLISSDNRDLKSWDFQRFGYMNSIKLSQGKSSKEIGHYYSIEFDSFFTEIVKKHLIWTLINTEFDGGLNYTDHKGNFHTESDIEFRWLEDEEKYEAHVLQGNEVVEKNKQKKG